ncbi:MAG: methyltransferase domain-containing protein, partial [Candidatus Hodarchaeota archaeon]
ANFFDLVFAIGVFYYTPNTQKAIDETFRVLKPDGKTIAMFYNKYSWYVLLAKVSGTNLDHEEKDPPISKLYSVKQVRKMFKKFSIVDIIMNRFPFKTVKRSGSSVKLYNYAFVPFTKVIPKTIMQPFGFHIIVKATK